VASTEAAINVIINGQERINKLISSFEKFDNLVASVNKSPINLNIGNVERQIASLEKTTNSALQKASALREQAEKKSAAASERLVKSIENSSKVIQELESKGAQSTKRYASAVKTREAAVEKLADANRQYAESLEEIEAIERRANTTRSAGLERLERNKKNIEAVNNLVDDYIVKARRAERQQVSVPAKLSSQIQLFKQLADNVDATGENFRKFTLAGVTAEIDAAQVSIRKYQVLADALGSREGKKPSFAGISAQDFAGPRQAVQELVQSFPKVAKSEAGLNSYREQLLSVQRLVTSASPEFTQLAGAIRAVDQEIIALSAKDLSRLDRSISPKGPSIDLVTQQLQERARTESRVEKQSDRLYKLSERIEDKVISQVQKTRLLTDANKVLNVLSESRVEDAAKQLNLLEREIRAVERLERRPKPTNQTFGALGTGFMPVSGRGPSGIAPGSPADKQRSMKAKLTWQTALSQMADIAISNLSAGTQDAVALVQRRSAEIEKIERTTARLWKQFGGPALPPRLASSGGGSAMRSQPFRAGGPGAVTAALGSPKRAEAQIRSAEILNESLTGLDIKGVDVSQQKNSLQRVLNELRSSDLEISDQILNNYDVELNKIRDIVTIENKRLANTRALQKQQESGFDKSFQTFSTNLKDSSEFFGDLSPEQGIDKIVREFNKNAAGGRGAVGGVAENIVTTFSKGIKKGAGQMISATASVFNQVTQTVNDAWGIASPSKFMLELTRNLAESYVAGLEKQYPRIRSATERAFGTQSLGGGGFKQLPIRSFDPSGAGGEMDEMFRRFRNQIAALTTQPEIYRNILNALPSSAITTEMAGLASQRQLMSEVPSSIAVQRQIGSGELERYIATKYAEFARTIRAVDPWVGVIGDYQAFIDSIIASNQKLSSQASLPEASIAGLLGPSAESLDDARRLRIATALQRSAERGRAVMGEMAGASPQQGVAAIGGLDSNIDSSLESQLARLGRVIPDFVARLTSGIADVFARAGGPGGGGGGRFGGGGGGGGGGAEELLSLDALARPAEASTRSLTELVQVLNEFRLNLDRTRPGFERIDEQLRVASARTSREVQRRDPQAELLTRRFGPRGGRAVSEGLIGAAFPLLFGQGAGSSIFGGLGGAVGGFAGGGLGMGLSLAGTAIGTFVDGIIMKAGELGSALSDTSGLFDLMKERSLFSTKEVEKLVGKIQELGLVATAAAAAEFDLFLKVGQNGIDGLVALETQSDRLGRATAEAAVQIQAAIAGPLSSLQGLFAGFLERGNLTRRAYMIEGQLRDQDPELYQSFGAEVARATNLQGGIPAGRSAADVAEQRLSVGGLSPEGLKAILDKFEGQLVFTANLNADQIKDELEKLFNLQVDGLQKRLETISIGKGISDQIRNAARQQEDLDKQRFDLILAYERSIEDARRSIEEKITSQRLDNVRKANEALSLIESANLQRLKNAGSQMQVELFGDDLAQQVAQVINEYSQGLLSAENESADRRRRLEADLQSQAIEFEKFKLDSARQIARLNEDTAKTIANTQRGVIRSNEDYDRVRFGLEKSIASLRLQIMLREVKTQEEKLNQSLAMARRGNVDQQIIQELSSSITILNDQYKDIENTLTAISTLSAPSRLSFAGFDPSASVSTAGVESAIQRSNELKVQIASLQEELASLVNSGRIEEFNLKLLSLSEQGATAAKNKLQELMNFFELGAGGPIKRITESFDSLRKQFEGNEGILELIGLQEKLTIANTRAAETSSFFGNALEQQKQEVESLSDEINKLIAGPRELDRVLQDLTLRGLSPASDEFKRLVKNASEIDRLRDKKQIFDDIGRSANELTGSLRSLVQETFELGSLSQAIQSFNDRIAKQSFNLLLDIAFRPVEDAMKKGMIEGLKNIFPDLDLDTEAQKQLSELTTLNATAIDIKNQITALTGRISPEFTKEAIPGSFDSSSGSQMYKFTHKATGAITTTTEGGFQHYLEQIQKTINMPRVQGLSQESGQLPYSQRVDRAPYRQWNPATQGLVPPGQQHRVNDWIGPQSSVPGTFSGMGGPREAFPMPEGVITLEIESYNEAQKNINTVEESIRDLNGATLGTPQGLNNVTNGLTELNDTNTKVAGDVLGSLQENNGKLNTVVPQWGKNLGQAVTGLSMASTAVMGIIGGFQTARQGGAGNIFSGIGSILTTIGGIGLSAAGMFGGGGGGGSPTASGGDWMGAAARALGNANGNIFDNGELMRFANGGILQSPTLFNFEDSGVSRTGQAGEAGPEAIMPLKRTKDGRLGVEADLSVPFEGSSLIADEGPVTGSLDPASVPFQSQSGDAVSPASVPFQGEGGRNAQQRLGIPFERTAGAMQQPLSVPFMKTDGTIGSADFAPSNDTIKFESMVINSVEYVTKAEAEQIGRASAARGADLAQRRIKNNPQVRRSIGV
jgi:hypothetical protein